MGLGRQSPNQKEAKSMVHLILNAGLEHVEKLTGHPPLQKMGTERAPGDPNER